MARLEIDKITKIYGSDTVLDEVEFTVPDGELVTVLGHSGSGKTTVLRSIAGFITPESGDIRVDGSSIVTMPVNKRGIGVVFQNYALFPHMSVADNIAFGLRMQHLTKSQIAERVDRELDRVQLRAHADKRPSKLSGGQQQRVAIARVLALQPSVVLFDEPLSNLDAMLRDALRAELKQLQRDLGFTAVFVTHDQKEAMTLADHIAVMDQGRLVQYGTPEEVYAEPAQAEVASLLGKANLLSGVVQGNDLIVDGQVALRLDSTAGVAAGDKAVAMIRPESLLVDFAGGAQPAESTVGTVVAAEVTNWDFLGATVMLHTSVPGTSLALSAQVLPDPAILGALRLGASVLLTIRPHDIKILQG